MMINETNNNRREIRMIELFGGIGAPRAAMRNLGIPARTIDYVENDPKAVRSYNAIFRNDMSFHERSVTDYSLRPDMLVHGSPCRDFSIAGERAGGERNSNTRSSLMWETIRIIRDMGKLKPDIVLWENVRNVLSKNHINTFRKYITEMERLGYTSSYRVLNAMDFGIPRNRSRVFTISMLDGTVFDFDRLERKPMRDIHEFLVDDFDERYFARRPSILKKINSESPSFRVKIIRDRCETITTKRMRTPNAGVIEYEKGRYRYLTELECWRLMGFSDEDYYNALSVNPGMEGRMNSTMYRRAGNSIVVPVLESIFKSLFL